MLKEDRDKTCDLDMDADGGSESTRKYRKTRRVDRVAIEQDRQLLFPLSPL